ncbi:MAG TPA: acyltransferase, partial [Pedococcus sp.]|nr:acyltransferase [Pedococcus sp.]
MSVSARADVAGSVARLAWVDRLKVATIAGVVVVHVATAYVVDIGWYYEERTTSQVTPVVLGVPAFLAGVFGLAPLFLVGGWMAAGSLARRGAGPFARARLVRLGVPTLLYFLLVDPFADYLGGRVQGESRTLVDYLTDIGGDRDLGPVWFITVLLVLSLAYAAWRRVRPPRGRTGPLTWRILAAAALGIALADLVLWQRWSYFAHTLWNLNWQHWAQAGGVFAVGALARERGWLDDVPRRLARTSGVSAAASLVLFTALAGYGFATEDESLVTGFGPFAVTFALVDGIGALT